MDKKKAEKLAEFHAIHNAVKFNGKANPKAVLGNVIKDWDNKEDIPKLKSVVEHITNKVNKMSLEDIEIQAKEMPKKEVKKEKIKGLKPIKDASKNNFVVRIEPSPSGALHIGHAFGLLVNFIYSKTYNGKFILRISDTNPDNIYPTAYKLIEEDVAWLCQENITAEVQSDRMKLYYSYAEEALQNGFAYVCKCSGETFKKFSDKMKPCPCRENIPADNIALWEQMLDNLEPGSAVVRIKTDMAHKNPAMRDWPALRINTSEHIRQKSKYRVWPLLNFAVAVDDHEMGLTHVINGKDQADNSKKQGYLYDYFKWEKPKYLHWGFINFKNMEVSATKTREKIDNGDLNGWDDIRIPYLKAYRRRGYHPLAFHKFVEATGLTLNDKTVSKDEFYKLLDSFNKDLIEESSNRYFFLHDPVEIKVNNASEQKVKLKLHPDFPKRGNRELVTKDRFYIQKEDHNNIKDGKIIRLMDCLNFKKNSDSFEFIDTDYQTFKKDGNQIIHWLPSNEEVINVEILMSDHKIIKGIGESSLNNINEGDVIQFERFGFCRLDKIENNQLKFWFCHK